MSSQGQNCSGKLADTLREVGYTLKWKAEQNVGRTALGNLDVNHTLRGKARQFDKQSVLPVGH